MRDKNRTKEKLLKELKAAHKRIAKLEAAASPSVKPSRAKQRVSGDETRWRCLFESNPHPMWIYDKESLAFLSVNNAAIAHYGYGRDEFLSMTIKDIRPPQDMPKFLEAIARPMTGYEARRSWRHRKKDGTIIDVEITTHSTAFDGRNTELVMAYDITERKRSGQQTNDALNFIRTIVENSPIGIVSIKATGAVVSANEAIARISGGTVDQLLKQNVRSLEAWKKYGLLSAFDEALLSNSEKEIDTNYVSTFGSTAWISVRFVPYIYAGEPHVLSLFSDMTGRKRDEAEKEQLQAQLVQAQKMEAIGQLAGGVAHDFNNLLTAISGYGSILQMSMGDNDPLRINADQILELTGRAAQLTQSLLAFSRKQIMNMKPISLNGIVDRMDKFLHRIIGEDIEMQTFLRNDAVMMADSGQIEQVLMNLATNARDAMPKGGQFIVETDVQKITDEFMSVYELVAPGVYAVISVTDTGIGMSEEARQKIFEPFFTNKGVGRGTDLGLAIVYGIIKQHKGYITVYSEIGKGTTFKIYLPVHSGRPEQQ